MEPREILEQNREAIEDLCRRFHVVRLRIFGSAANGSWESDSDFDFLVEYGQGSRTLPPLDRLVGLEAELEELLGRRVDAVDWNAASNPYFRESAEETAELFYAA
ncbi:MAG: nucleotidyltransferase domain-containing protein [Fimbriimonadaceae bacterium]